VQHERRQRENNLERGHVASSVRCGRAIGYDARRALGSVSAVALAVESGRGGRFVELDSTLSGNPLVHVIS